VLARKTQIASPGSLSVQLLMNSPPEIWSLFTLSYHQGWRVMVWDCGDSPSIQMVSAARALGPAQRASRAAKRRKVGSLRVSREIVMGVILFSWIAVSPLS
jgi:hypothetical protein